MPSEAQSTTTRPLGDDATNGVYAATSLCREEALGTRGPASLAVPFDRGEHGHAPETTARVYVRRPDGDLVTERRRRERERRRETLPPGRATITGLVQPGDASVSAPSADAPTIESDATLATTTTILRNCRSLTSPPLWQKYHDRAIRRQAPAAHE